MTWFYVYAGKQAGPVEETQLEGLVNAGYIGGDTLVWREGMAEWQPWHQARPADAPPVMTFPPVLRPDAVGPNESVCSQCGGIFPAENTIVYGRIRICANCKPVFLQKLSEGARFGLYAPRPEAGRPNISVGLPYAGFWVRFAAEFLDRMILIVVNIIINFLGTLAFFQTFSVQTGQALAIRGALLLLELIIGFSYETVLVAKFGATLGKMACKIKIVRADGEPLGYGLACGRYFAKILSGLTIGVGFILAAFDEEKRTLHDRIC